MNVWEKTLVNIQRGYEKLTLFAATFSDRVKAEITIMRLKAQADERTKNIEEQQRIVGRTLIELRSREELPRNFTAFFKMTEITSALEKIEQEQTELENIKEELEYELDALRSSPAAGEEQEK